MRPVEKKNVGETVSYVNSKNQTITETIQEYYSPYNNTSVRDNELYLKAL